MATPSHPTRRICFGEFELDLSTRELWTDGTKQMLAPQPFQLLKLLIENRGQLVTHDTLVKHLWPADTFVDYEQGLKKAVNRLREVLNDSAEQPRFIENLPRQGYRFIGQLEVDTEGRTRPAEPIVLTPRLVAEEPRLIRPGHQPISVIHVLWLLGGVLCVGAVLFWRGRISRDVHQAPRDLKIIQLTANSLENAITSSAISPDGKYLAFTDNTMQIWVKLLETGETQSIPHPESLKGKSVDWNIAAWFPDSTRFIVNASPPFDLALLPNRFRFLTTSRVSSSTNSPAGQLRSVWIISLIGKTPQKLRDDADAFSVSPDGSSIAFGTNARELGDREIWLMDSRGQKARKLYDAPQNTAIGGFSWSLDGERAIYFKLSATGGELVSRDLHGGPAIPLLQFSDWRNLTDFVWLPDGRLIYARSEEPSNRYCNFWQLRIEPHSGKPLQKPEQLTNWPGFCVGEASVTADGLERTESS